jgi:hypothetical protein
MSELTVVQFQTSPSMGVHLSELADGPPFTVHGVALGADDVTVGQSGIKKKWPADELRKAAETLKGTNLVEDHQNNAAGVVGRVTKAGYKEGTGVVYEAELYDEELADKIKNGLLEVSIRGFHADVDALEEDEETDAKIVEDIEFDNLSIVPTGAAPSNTLEMGEHAELSAAALSQFTDTLDEAELAEIEPGMWVTTGDTHGITIGQVEDGEVEVDIYEESDGTWMSTGETEMMDTDSLDEWDVDEEDIGAAEDDESEEENAPILEEGIKFFDTINDSTHTIAAIEGNQVRIEGEDGSQWTETKEDVFEKIAQGEWEHAGADSSDSLAGTGDKVKWDSSGGMAQGVVRDRKTDGCFNERIDGDFEVCADDDDPVVLIEIVKDGDATGTMVAHKESTVNSADFEMAELEASDGDFVQWKGVNGEMMYGQIVSVNQDGQQMVAEIRRFTKNGDALDEIVEKPLQGLEPWDRMSEGETPDSMRDDASGGIQAPEWQDGQMVKWQVNPAMKGKIVHVDREKKVLMVEVMENTEQGLQPTGYTLTAGYQDVVPMDEENAAVTTGDVPSQDAEPTHETNTTRDLLEQFMSQSDGSEQSLEDFVEWLETEGLSDRIEGEDEMFGSEKELENSREGEPHRFIDAEDESAELEERYDDYPEAASENAQMALDAKEETDNPNDCGTDVGWKRAKQLANGEGLTREQIGKMSAFNRHRQNSEMDDEEGKADCGWMMWKAWGGDEGVDWADEKLDQIEEENAMNEVPDDHKFSNRDDAMEKAKELGLDGVHEMDGMWMPGETHEEYRDHVSSNSGYAMDEEEEEASVNDGGDPTDETVTPDVEELKEYDMHEVSFDGTTTNDWSSPDMEDFETDDLSEIADHFLISSSGFPPENFGDLKLPIVEPNGDLNVNALAAVKGGRGVSAVEGLDEDMEEEIVEVVNNLANEEFDKDWGMEEEASQSSIDGSSGRPTASKTVGGVQVLSGDDLRQSADKSEESDVDSITTQLTTMTDNIEEKLSELDDPVAVEASEVEELRNKADRFEEMSENLEALKERTDILDEVDRSQVEELAESDDAVVVESARYEELTSEAEQVKGVYAEQLAEEYDAFDADELTDKFSIEELREKYETNFGSVEDLASSDKAEPRSQDADEESLEDAAGESDESEEELSETAAQKQEELKQKILERK